MREDRGQVLPLVAIVLIVILGLAAFVVDVGSWYVTQRQTQAAADSAALAGAQDLPGSASTATTDAQSYVSKNMSGASATVTTPYNSNSRQIKVTVTTTAPSFFASVLGLSAPGVTSTAVAANSGVQITAPLYAGGTSCTAIDGNINGASIGGMVTNGGLNIGGWNNDTISSLEYDNSTCPLTPKSGVTFQSTSFDTGNVPFPLDYRSTSQTINCTGNGATVTESGNQTQSNDHYTYSDTGTFKFSSNQSVSGIYCAQTIDLTNSMQINGTATFIASCFLSGISDHGTLTPAMGSLLLWQTGSGCSPIQINTPSWINGSVVFAPYAQIYLNSNAFTGGAQTTLLEGSSIYLNMNNGSLNTPSGLSSASSKASLVQ